MAKQIQHDQRIGGSIRGAAIAIASACSVLVSAPQAFAQDQNALPTPQAQPSPNFQPLQPNQPPPNMMPGAQHQPQQQQPLQALPAGQPYVPAQGQQQYYQNSNPQYAGQYATPPGQMPATTAPMPRPLPVNMQQQVLDSVAPMTPGEIRNTRQAIEERRNALTEPMYPQAKPTRRSITADLNPGSVPQVIRASAYNGAVVTFIDATGQSWQIDRVENFNPRDFDVSLFGENGLSIAVKTMHAAAGNFAVRLKDLNTPMTFNIASGQVAVDSAVEVQIPRYLPGNSPAITGESSPGLDHQLTNYLLGTPPAGVKRLETNSKAVRAWQISDTQMIVVTNQRIASPAVFARNSSSSGMHAFRLPLTPFIMLEDLSRVSISKFTTKTGGAK